MLKLIVLVYGLLVGGYLLLNGALNWGFVKNSTTGIVNFIKSILTPLNTVIALVVTPVEALVAKIPTVAVLLIIVYLVYLLV